jgi:Photosynthesis system II assembly factor YCF48
VNDHSDGLPESGTKPKKKAPSESAAERTARRQEIAKQIRERATRQKSQALLCIALVVLLLFGGGVFFYFAQTIALNELKAQSEFVSTRRAAIDVEHVKVKQDEDQLRILRRQIADRAAGFPRVQHQVIGAFPSSTRLRRISFADPTYGWAVGENGTILLTTDGGATWQKRDSGVSADLYGVHFTDPTHGWAVGDNGTILLTTDGGATGQKRDSGVSAPLYRVHFTDPTHGWAVGDSGTILAVTVSDLTQIVGAEDTASMQAALKSIQMSTNQIGQPLIDFTNTDADLNERRRRVEQDQKELETYFPDKGNADTSATSLLNNPMFLSNLNRLGVTVYVFFAVSIMVAMYRYSMRLSAHYDACADALELSSGAADGRFYQLVRSLSPGSIDFGKVPNSPVDHTVELLEAVLRGSKRT